MARKPFYRSIPRKGFPLFWILLVYLVIGFFYPVVGFLAVICMIAPVAFAVRRGRWWCGNAFSTIVCSRNIRPTRRFRHLFAPESSASSW